MSFTAVAVSPYAFQACDTFKWEFGDGTIATTRDAVHEYSFERSYTVKLTVSNPFGSATISKSLAFQGDMPCPTRLPADVDLGYRGATSRCSSPDDDCLIDEVISFDVLTQRTSCGSYHWDFGDGTSSSFGMPSHVYSIPGDYTVRLNISTSQGWRTITRTATRLIHVKGDCEAPPGEAAFEYSGAVTGCHLDQTPCMSGEEIHFVGTELGAPMQACDRFEWDFGDGTTATGRTASHIFGGGVFVVNFRITNPSGEKSATREVESFVIAGPPPPSVEMSAPTASTFSTNVPISFSGIASPPDGIVAYRWSFGDGGMANVAAPTHTFTQPGTYTVSFAAMNIFWWSGRAVKTLTIVDAIDSQFLIPAIAHVNGSNGVRWRTDLEIYNPDAPAPLPLKLTYAATGDQKRIVVSNSTTRVDDIFSELTSTDGAGPLLIEGTSKRLPIVRGRTYTIDGSGVPSAGQLTPAIQLLPLRPGNASSSKKILTGLEMSDRFRTNIGIIDTTTSPISVEITAFDEHGVNIGESTLALDPWQLVQFGRADLSTFVPATNGPFTIVIEGPAGAFVAYASKIDNASNDPLYMEACDVDVPATEQIVPAIGHLTTGSGTWKSDLLLYNPGAQAAVDLAYYDQRGTKIAEARHVALASGGIVHFDDVLRSGLFSPQPADSFGVIHVNVVVSGNPALRPILQARTYNDGFGEIIAGADSHGNTTIGNDSLIVAVSSDSRTSTNLGLLNLSDESTAIQVSLLDWISGQPIAAWSRELSPRESLVAPNVITDPQLLGSAAEFGTLRIHVARGGPVWAWASLVDRKTNDPEYVPAVPSN